MGEADLKIVAEVLGLALVVFAGGKAWSHLAGQASAAKREAHGIGTSLDNVRGRVEMLERSQAATDRELQIRAESVQRQLDRIEDGVTGLRDEISARIQRVEDRKD